MDFSLNDDQEMLRSVAQKVVAERFSIDPLLKPGAKIDSSAYDGHWDKMRELGWPGLVIPEDYDGLGLGMIEAVVIVAELGRKLVPSPFLGNLVGTWALLLTQSDDARQRLLPAIASGEKRIAYVHADGRRNQGGIISKGGKLSGTARAVLDADGADWLIVAAHDEESDVQGAWLVDANSAGISVERLDWRDTTRQVCEVRLDGATGEALTLPDGYFDTLEGYAALALAAESAAAMRDVHERTVAYVQERVAFGRTIASFQAIRHGLAETLGPVVASEWTVLYAAALVDEGSSEAPQFVSIAKSYTDTHFAEIARQGIQYFGAIGITWEMPNHLYLKRSLANALMFGDARRHRVKAMRSFLDAENI